MDLCIHVSPRVLHSSTKLAKRSECGVRLPVPPTIVWLDKLTKIWPDTQTALARLRGAHQSFNVQLQNLSAQASTNLMCICVYIHL